MELYTVTQVTKQLNITKRTLQHYEELGLITPTKKEDYAYRTYDVATITRIQQILILRKLRIPLKQIAEVLQSSNAAGALEMFENKLSEIDDEINALSIIRGAIEMFVERLNVNARLELLDDESVLDVVNSMKLSKPKFNEAKELVSMEKLDQAGRALDELTDRDVRIVYLPPATMAAVYFVGKDEKGRIPEDQGEDVIAPLLETLAKIKPDCRHYGFNHIVDGKHGYERWFTIPDDMEVQPPFVKKQFSGGMYGAYTMRNSFDEWDLLVEWATQHKKYEFATGNQNMMAGLLEEHLNVMGKYILPGVKQDAQIDLLIPLKERKSEWPDELGYIPDSETKCGVRAVLIEKKGFNLIGHKYEVPKDTSPDVFYKQLLADGRLERLKAALKPNAPIVGFNYWDGGYCVAIGADLQDAADKAYFKSGEMKLSKKFPKKKMIQFEMLMGDKDKSGECFNWAKNLGYKFDNSAGTFCVYLCRELVTTEENKNEPFHFWFPARPL